ncbi:hypothetical protein Clacol_005339 [Clathrus columnatus]|uniref:Symplekin n=1 Tax=Clathrus columnatus TaxID=1419009 RepID=A0AAV5ADA5_9AGAM|nr:hypothetical protein Clacol_005339 [Clathrus columnatus]
MAAINNASLDPLQTLSAALAVPADSPEQATLLTLLRETLEQQQTRIPILCTTLITAISNTGDSLLKRWVLDLLHFALARSSLPPETRTQLGAQSLDALAGLLNDSSPATVKVVIQCFATIYPLLFRLYCSNRTLRQPWETLLKAKAQILELITAPHASAGVKVAALKFMQRVILVQTRGISDPRLQNKADPNLALCPSDHPFISSSQLETEGMKLLERAITILFSSRSVDMLTAIVNSWSTLAKLRPPLIAVIVTSLAQWNPRQLEVPSALSIKSVEKAIRILLNHISRCVVDFMQRHRRILINAQSMPSSAPHIHQIQSALQKQTERMEIVAHEEKMRKETAALEASRKRGLPQSVEVDQGNAKRVKTEHNPDTLSEFLLNFDFSALPVGLVADIVIANLQLLTEQTLNGAIEAFRKTNPPASSRTVVPPAVAPGQPALVAASETLPVKIEEEPVDPLQMDMDEDDIEYEPDRLNDQLAGGEATTHLGQTDEPPLTLVNFQLPPPRPLSGVDRRAAIRSAITRIRTTGEEFGPPPELAGPKPYIGLPPQEMWILLLVRMVTRAKPVEEQEASDDDDSNNSKKEEEAGQEIKEDLEIRETLCDYILDDFPSRVRIASVWMNEEWFNDRLRLQYNPRWQPQYESWLQKIVAAHQERLNAKDKAFTQFLLDLPALPDSILALLREFCTDPDKTQVGFLTLREFVTLRPPLRHQALGILLELTTHPSKAIRTPAINTVKRWVPDTHPMDEIVRTYSLRLLRRLQKHVPVDETKQDQDAMHEDGLEDGQLPQEEILQTMYLPEEVTVPADKAQVLQHVELTFALSVRVPDLLDEVFSTYTQMDVTVQEAIQDLITALVKSMGPSHPKLLALLRTFPPGADTLALRILTIFTDSGRLNPTIVSLVKGLISERDLDARFLIPIIAEMDKNDILRHLPRIVSMLNGSQEPKNLVRSVFESIVATPPQTFGSVTSNLPRVRQSELLTPAELMVLLHHCEKEIAKEGNILDDIA